jgi:hypothetical protein
MDEVRARVMPEHDDETACEIGVDNFATAMRAKLAEARAKGRNGWNVPEECSLRNLADSLLNAVIAGDLISISNYAMMLHQRDPDVAGKIIRRAFAEAATQYTGAALDHIIEANDNKRIDRILGATW